MLTAEEWLAVNYPDELASFPQEDTGRDSRHREVSLEAQGDAGYYEQKVADRPGTHRNPGWRRREALQTQHVEIARNEAARAEALSAVPEAERCTHCHLNPRRTSRVTICEACQRYRRRHGVLPPEDVVVKRRRDLEAALP